VPSTASKKTARKTVARPKMQRVPVLRSPDLTKISWLVHGFSTRKGGTSPAYGGGSLNLGFTGEDTRARVEANRKKFLIAAGATNGSQAWPLVALKQIHSDLIHVVRSRAARQFVGDGLVTDLPGVALAVQTADCFPVILADRRTHAVGVFHAGWRGTVKRIAEKGLGIMRLEYGTLPADVTAAIGPGIGRCCYKVGEELKAEFESQFSYSRELFHEVFESDPVREKYPMLFLSARAPGHSDFGPQIHLDIADANRRQLLAAGVPESQIDVMKHCTSCESKTLFSYRAERGKTGRMMVLAGIKA
jgi:polyphenol oxidase